MDSLRCRLDSMNLAVSSNMIIPSYCVNLVRHGHNAMSRGLLIS